MAKELFMIEITCLRLEMGVMNLRIKILKQREKHEIVIVQNEEKVIRGDLSALLGESVETEDPVLAMQYKSYEHEKKNDHNHLD